VNRLKTQFDYPQVVVMLALLYYSLCEFMNKEIQKAIKDELHNSGRVRIFQPELIKVLRKKHGWQDAVIAIELNEMRDLGIVGNDPEIDNHIRLTASAHAVYGSPQERWRAFWVKNWPHVTANLIALAALGVALFKN
jgi:hypothetical protein